jgi:hypothetical protein
MPPWQLGLDDFALAGHPRVGAVGINPQPRGTIKPRDERLAPVPYQEASAVYRCVGEAPERIVFIGQEVWREKGIVDRPYDVPADRAVGSARFDSIHRR